MSEDILLTDNDLNYLACCYFYTEDEKEKHVRNCRKDCTGTRWEARLLHFENCMMNELVEKWMENRPYLKFFQTRCRNYYFPMYINAKALSADKAFCNVLKR